MDYNSRIRWQEGMMLTKELFAQLEADYAARQQIAIHTAIGDGRFGLLPDMPFSAEGIFVRRVYEMTGLQCTALLPSGRFITVNADLKLPIDIASNEDADFYVCLGYGTGQHEYEREGVPYTSPEVGLSLLSPDQAEQLDVLPLKHFSIRKGALGVDDDYIPPTLTMAVDARYAGYVQGIADKLTALAAHPNMDHGDAKRTLLRYAFRLRSLRPQHGTGELLELLDEIAQATDFYVVDGLGATIKTMPEQVLMLRKDAFRTPRMTDTVSFMKWMGAYLDSQLLIMEQVVIEKAEIDVEAIKREVKETLQAELYEALSQKLLEQLRQQLTEELPEPITEQVKAFLEEKLRPVLRTELHDDLRHSLYDDLYNALLAALNGLMANLDFKQEDNFVPLI